MTSLLLVLVLVVPQEDRARRELARWQHPEHGWFTWSHVVQILRHYGDTRAIQRAFTDANARVGFARPDTRGVNVEQEAIRGLGRDAPIVSNVVIVEKEGRPFIERIGSRTAGLGTEMTLAEADLLRLKPGRTLVLGEEFDKSAVEAAWELKTSSSKMKRAQRLRYRTIFGVEPIEIHPTSAWRAAAVEAGKEIGSLGTYLGGWLLKEGLVALETRDAGRLGRAFDQVQAPEFWRSAVLFSVGARAAEVALRLGQARGVLRAPVPLAAGMLAAQLASGRVSWRELVIGTTAYSAAGFAVSAVMDRFVYGILFSGGPPSFGMTAVYLVARAGLSLYAGEKLATWLAGFGGREKHMESGGVITEIRRME